MRRPLLLGLTLGLMAPVMAHGQAAPPHMSMYFALGQDSALALIPGVPGRLILTLDTFLSGQFSCYGLSSYSFTIQFDPAELADPAGFAVPSSGLGTPTVTNRPGEMDLVGSGSYQFCNPTPAQVDFTLQPAAAQGATVFIQANALSDFLVRPGLETLLSSVPLRICHASKLWGDFDASLGIDSRDALIALTAAVGLPIGGFDASVGDVDQDAVVTSRDALMILSAGLGSFTGSRVAKGVADGCPSGGRSPVAPLKRTHTGPAPVALTSRQP